MVMPDRDDITWGGFIKSNIRNALIKECIESGDPENFFSALSDIVEELWDEIEDHGGDEEFWEEQSKRYQEPF